MCIPRTNDLKSTPLRKVCLNRDFRREYIHIYRTAEDSTAGVCPTCWGFCGREFCSSDIAVPSILGPRVSERCKGFSFNRFNTCHIPHPQSLLCVFFLAVLYLAPRLVYSTTRFDVSKPIQAASVISRMPWSNFLESKTEDYMYCSRFAHPFLLEKSVTNVLFSSLLYTWGPAHDLLTLLAHGSLTVSEGVFWDSFEHQKKVHLCCSRACVCRTKGTQLSSCEVFGFWEKHWNFLFNAGTTQTPVTTFDKTFF